MMRYSFYVRDTHTFKFEAARRLADPEDAKAHAVVVAKELARTTTGNLKGIRWL
jgi:hypothetical protein